MSPPQKQVEELTRILTGLIKAYSCHSNDGCSSTTPMDMAKAKAMAKIDTTSIRAKELLLTAKISNSEILNLLKKMPKFYLFLHGERGKNSASQSQLEMEGTRLLICLINLCFQRWNGHLDVLEDRSRRSRGSSEKFNDDVLSMDEFIQIINADHYEWPLIESLVNSRSRSKSASTSAALDDQASLLLTDKFLQPLLGQIIIMVLDQLESAAFSDAAASTQGKLLILNCLNSIISSIIFESSALNSPFQSVVMADRMAQFLPALFSCLAKLVLKRSVNENHKVIVACYHLMGMVVSTCLKDDLCTTFLSSPLSRFMLDTSSALDPEAKSLPPQPPMPAPPASNDSPYTLLNRDEAWLKATFFNISKALPSLLLFISHDLWKVRLAVLRMVVVLLKNCNRTLQECVDLLVQTILQGVSDDFSQVAQFSQDSIGVLARETSWFQQALERNMQRTIMGTSELLRHSDKVKSTLLSLNSHLCLASNVLGSTPSLNVYIEQGMDNLFDGLLHLLTPDTESSKNIVLLQENFESLSFLDHSAFSRDKSWKLVGFPKPDFKYFQDVSIFDNALKLFSGLVKAAPDLVFEELTRRLEKGQDAIPTKKSKRSHPLFKNDPTIANDVTLANDGEEGDAIKQSSNAVQCLMLLNEFTRSCQRSDLIEALVPIYLSRFQQCCIQKSTKLDTLSLHQTTLLLEGIAATTLALQAASSASYSSPQKVHFLMMDSLYLVLTLLAHPNYNIKSAAHNALEVMGKVDQSLQQEGGEDVDESRSRSDDVVVGLVSRYSDYLFDRVLDQIRYPTLYPFSPRLVGAIAGVCGPMLLSAPNSSSGVRGQVVIEVVESVVDILDVCGSSGGVIGSVGLGSVEEFVGVLCGVLRYCCRGDQAIAALSLGELTIKSGFTFPSSNFEDKTNIGKNNAMKEYIQLLQDRKKEREDEDKMDPQAFFKQYHEKKTKEQNDDLEKDNDNSGQDEQESPSFPPEPEVVLTQTETVASIVLERAVFLLTSDSVRVRVLVLEALQSSIALLCKQSTKLYPFIHALWPLLLKRCHDPAPAVVVASLKVLQLICQTCGDFIRQRLEKDVIDGLLSVLAALQAKAVNSTLTTKYAALPTNPKPKAYQLSVHVESSRTSHDLFLATLSSLEEVAKYVPLKSEQAHKLILILVSFLNSSLYTSAVILKSTNILRSMVCDGGKGGGGYKDFIWITLMVALEGARKPSLSVCGGDKQRQHQKIHEQAWRSSRKFVGVFGKPRDFMQSVKGLIDCFDGPRFEQLRVLLMEE